MTSEDYQACARTFEIDVEESARVWEETKYVGSSDDVRAKVCCEERRGILSGSDRRGPGRQIDALTISVQSQNCYKNYLQCSGKIHFPCGVWVQVRNV